MIEVKNMDKKYGTNKVLDNVSLKIERGKVTSFIGPNGAGKSTLLSIISRLMDKDSGQVFIDGKELEDWDTKELAKKISILKQFNHINIRLTVRDLVSFGRFPYCNGKLTEEDWQQVDEAIDYMKLKDIEYKYLDQLSGGQKQRAYIAMIIAQDTDYILLDEPLNNLDMKHSVEIMKTLRRLAEEKGKTVLIVIHDINFVSCYSDHIVVLCKGKVVEKGGADDILREDLLEKVYELDFCIKDINNNKICLYY